MKEALVKRAVCDYLQYLDNRSDLYFFRSGTGAIQTKSGSYFTTGRKGCPDITVLYNGRYIALECKSDKGKLSAEQKITEAQIKDCGGEYYVIRTLDDVMKIIGVKKVRG